MGILETTRTAFESLIANRLRAALTMLGVIIGTMSVVLILALGAGVQNYINTLFSSLGTNLIVITADASVSGARLLSNDVVTMRNSVPNLRRVIPQVTGQLEVIGTEARKTLFVNGVTPEYFPMRLLETAQGNFFSITDNDSRLRKAVIGDKIARDLFGSQPALDQTVLIANVPYRIVGVVKLKGGSGPGDVSPDDTVFVPVTTAQERLFVDRPGGTKSLTTITAEAIDGKQSKQTVQAIADALRKQHNLVFGQKDDFRIFDQASALESVNGVLVAFQIFLAAIGAISLVVGGIGIMNIMLVSVTERTREIGVRKAIGASPANIRLQFLVESLVVTLIAGLIGVLLAVGISMLVGLVQENFKPVVGINAIVLAVGVSVLIGVSFGLYPAFRASRMQPVEALRYE